MADRVSVAFLITLIVHGCCMEVTIARVNVEVIQQGKDLQAVLLF